MRCSAGSAKNSEFAKKIVTIGGVVSICTIGFCRIFFMCRIMPRLDGEGAILEEEKLAVAELKG